MTISYGHGGAGSGGHAGGGGGGSWSDTVRLLKPLARALSRQEIPHDKQARIFLDVLGIKIGSGGKGGEGSNLAAECMYCHQTGNGGHGGFCPNGSW